jgi:signal transduction histidine kinase
VDRIVAAVVVLSRVTVLGMVALSVAPGVQSRAYADAPLAAAVYLAVTGYAALFLALVARGAVPAWAMAADVAVASAAMIALPLAAQPEYFTAVGNADFEPVMVTVAVSIALITGSVRSTAAGCAALAAAYATGQAHVAGAMANAASSIASPIFWQVTTAACCAVFIRRLRAVAGAVDDASRRVLEAREKVAADRAEAEQRQRHFREQVRRHRALHDGPLRILTAIAGPGPLGHPEETVRRQCAAAVNVLRGITPDDPEGTLTDLSLALIEAGGQCAAAGLRVQYRFAGLPDSLPAEVVQAFALAAAEALSNVCAHAGTTRARLTALAGGEQGRPAVTVAVVDQGKGFDPDVTEPGYGIRHSILERMREAGGDASIDSAPGQGTRVDLRWPR